MRAGAAWAAQGRSVWFMSVSFVVVLGTCRLDGVKGTNDCQAFTMFVVFWVAPVGLRLVRRKVAAPSDNRSVKPQFKTSRA